MAIRTIVSIDEAKCNGCGLCIPNCAEGAIQIIDGKAKLLADKYCDGLGACLGHCPQDAITLIEREADEFDEVAVEALLQKLGEEQSETVSKLRQWPVQLHLVSPEAPFLRQAHLLISADCVAYAYANFHEILLDGKTLIIACPKLDDVEGYLEKLVEIFRKGVRSITVAIMEVGCCGGLRYLVDQAIKLAGQNIPINTVVVSTTGELIA